MSKFYARRLLEDALKEPKPTPNYKSLKDVTDFTLKLAEYNGRIEASIRMALNELK